MPTNFYMYFAAALIPFFLGAVWYGPLFGKSWMKTNNFTEEYLKEGNMLMILGLSYLLSVLFALGIGNWSIHQSSILGLFVPEMSEMGSAIQVDVAALMEKYGDRHRTFSHGAAHGMVFTILIALPLIAVNALFERRGWKYIMIHLGYWLLASVLMGGLLCATLTYPAM